MAPAGERHDAPPRSDRWIETRGKKPPDPDPLAYNVPSRLILLPPLIDTAENWAGQRPSASAVACQRNL